MFNVDPRTLARLAAELGRVLVFDPQPAAGKLVGDLLRDMGARQVTCATQTARGLELIAHVEPHLICTEVSGVEFNGVELIARLRRSSLACRKVPVIVVAGEATVEGIKAARDAGAHEFLRKPFTAKDLFRRVENVALKPRPWIEAQAYVGPDRRRFNSGGFTGDRKRLADAEQQAEDAQAAVAAAAAA